MGVAGFLLVLYPKPCPLSPASQAGKVLLWGCRATLLSCPQTGTLGREGWRERRFGKISGLASFGDADNHPPAPTPGWSREGRSLSAPGRRGRLPPPAGRSPGQVGAPAGAGIWCRLQLAVRRARSWRPAGPPINNAATQHGVGQPWPARSPGAAGTAPPRPRGRTVQGLRGRPYGEGALDGFPSPTHQHLWWVKWSSRGAARGGATR